jgi:hypothetical protein
MVTFDQSYRYHDTENVSGVQHLSRTRLVCVGRDSPVDIATLYGLDVPEIKRRWRGEGGKRFSIPVQTGLGHHPASCTTGIGSLSREYSGRSTAFTSHPDLAPTVRKKQSSSSVPSWSVLVCTTFYRISSFISQLVHSVSSICT